MSKNIKRGMGISSINEFINVNWEFTIVPLKDCESYLSNPFPIEGIVRKPRTIRGKMREFLDGDGVLRPMMEVDRNAIVEHDEKKFVKAYVDSGDVMRKLTFRGIKGFLYCLYHLPLGRDVIMLNKDDVCLWCDFDKTTYFKVLSELIGFKIIARKVGTHLEYFINPNVMFNGNRINLSKR